MEMVNSEWKKVSTRVIDVRAGHGLCFTYGAPLSDLLILLMGSLLLML